MELRVFIKLASLKGRLDWNSAFQGNWPYQDSSKDKEGVYFPCWKERYLPFFSNLRQKKKVEYSSIKIGKEEWRTSNEVSSFVEAAFLSYSFYFRHSQNSSKLQTKVFLPHHLPSLLTWKQLFKLYFIPEESRESALWKASPGKVHKVLAQWSLPLELDSSFA